MIVVWDFLVLVLVLFPFLTGGVWISRPGFFLELSDLGVPVLVVALLGAIFSFCGARLEESRSARGAFTLWRGWARLLETRPVATLGWASFFNGALWLAGSIKRYLEVNQHQMDLTIFVNAIWNLTHGNGYYSATKGGVNLLLDHQSPIFWLLAPVFALIPHPITLLTIQAFAVSFGAFAAYGIARQYLGKEHWLAPATPLLYWAYLPVRNAVGFDFHPETLMLPLFLFAIWGCQSERIKQRILGCILLFLSLATKESAPIVALGLAAGWVLGAAPEGSRKFTRILGAALVPVAIGLFWFDTQWLPGALGAKSYAYQGEYAELGGSLVKIVLSPIINPHEFWARVLRPTRFKFLLWTLAPLAFFPLVHPKRFLAALPPYIMLFLSKGDTRVHIGYHYGIETAVALFWALPGEIPKFSRKAVAVWCLFCALVTFGRSEVGRVRFYTVSDHARWLMSAVIPCIDENASLSASVALSSHLATRRWISLFPRTQTTDGPVSCVVYDPNIVNMDMAPHQAEEAMKSADFHEVLSCPNGFKVLAQGDANCLKCNPTCN